MSNVTKKQAKFEINLLDFKTSISEEWSTTGAVTLVMAAIFIVMVMIMP